MINGCPDAPLYSESLTICTPSVMTSSTGIRSFLLGDSLIPRIDPLRCEEISDCYENECGVVRTYRRKLEGVDRDRISCAPTRDRIALVQCRAK